MKTNKLSIVIVAVLLGCISFISCASDSPETGPTKSNGTANRITTTTARGMLIINNNTADLDLDINVLCYGDTLDVVEPDIILFGHIYRPLLAGDFVEYINMNTESTPGINSDYVINSWRHHRPSVGAIFTYYTGAEANNMYGEYYDIGDTGLGKFAHWQILKISIDQDFTNPLSTSERYHIEGGIDVELPEYIDGTENTNIESINLTNYGFHDVGNFPPYLHIIAESKIQANGDTTVDITSYVDTTP